ncbi:hypothetical protein GINT2_000246 [Glugoides intestinalis]
MEEIEKVFKDIIGLDALAKMYRQGKREINDLEDAIALLKEERAGLNVSQFDVKIKEYESKLEMLTKELECDAIVKNTCLSLDELKRALGVILDESICLEKSLEFMKTLVVSFEISNFTLETVFKIEKEEEHFTVIKISKETEDLLKMLSGRTFLRDAENAFKSIISSEINDAVPFDVEIFSSEDDLYLVFPSEESLTEDKMKINYLKRETFESFFNGFRATAKSILTVLKANFSRCFIRDSYSREDILLNNEKLKGTDFYIEGIEEWTLDIVMKEVTSLSKASKNVNELHQVDDHYSGKFVSSSYNRLIRLTRFINESASKRKEKAQAFFEKAISVSFDIKDTLTLQELFIAYSDISHFTKKYKQTSYTDALDSKREELFYQILKKATKINIDLSDPVLYSKSKIKQMQFDFDENLENFVAQQTCKFFKIQFFEKLYGNFLEFVLKPRKISADDKIKLKDLAQYLLDISFEIGTESIVNYSQISSLYEIFDSSLEEIIELYKFGTINLKKHDLRTLIRFIFDDTDVRKEFIDILI